jgi:hypothetical protein
MRRTRARAIAHGQREWFSERFLKWTKVAGVKDAKTTARAFVVLLDGAVAGSEVDGTQRPRRSMDGQGVVGRLNARALLTSTERPSLKCSSAPPLCSAKAMSTDVVINL